MLGNLNNYVKFDNYQEILEKDLHFRCRKNVI